MCLLGRAITSIHNPCSTWNILGGLFMSYQERLGARLRAIRGQQGLTLQDVEERSSGEWKAVVVGSYERGDRAVSVTKLARLADFYGVPVNDLLPTTGPMHASPSAAPRLVVDLVRLEGLGEDQGYGVVRRYVRRVQTDRGDYNGRVITLRSADIRSLAVACDDDPDELIVRLSSVGALR